MDGKTTTAMTMNVKNAKLYRADCLEVLPELPTQSVELILTDLPYGVTDCAWDSVIPLERLWAEYKRLLKPGGAVVLTAQQPFTTDLINSNRKWFRYCLVWDKHMVTGHLNAKRQPMRQHEDVLVFYPKQPTYNPQFSVGTPYTAKAGRGSEVYGKQREVETVNDGRRYPTSIISIPQVRQKDGHPTGKPLSLMEYLVMTYSNEGDQVLDNTMGHGPTGVAAVRNRRRFVGIEQDKGYFAVASGRIRAALEESLTTEAA